MLYFVAVKGNKKPLYTFIDISEIFITSKFY